MPSGKDIIRRYDKLRSDASTHFSRCDRMAQYISPSRVGILGKRSPGANQIDDVYDSTAMFAADLLAKYIAGEVINPAQMWHRWKLRKPKGVEEKTEADEWIEECTDRAHQERRDSNFYAEAPEMLVDYGGFGTGCLLGDERKEYRDDAKKKYGFRGLRFQATKTGRFVITEDEEGKVNGVWREYTVSAEAAARRWGADALPKAMRDCLPSGGRTGDPDKQFDIVHCVYPRDKGERGEYKGAKGYAFASCWVEKSSTEIIEESGYRRFPFMVPRWEKTPGEVFGRGPGDRAFPDTRTLNTAKKMGLEDWALKIRPPIIVAHDSVIGNVRIRPAAPTTLRMPPGGDVRKVMAPWETGSHPEVSQIKEEELRRQIRQLFFVDQILQMLQVEGLAGGSKPQMTAYEFQQKLQLLYKILGSVYGRMESEFLIPETELTFALMLDAGAFPPPPPELLERRMMGEAIDIDVEFTSPIALAQKMSDVDAIRSVYGDITVLAMGDANRAQRMAQNFDDDVNIRIIAERRGMPEKGIKSEEDRDAIRDEIMKKQQEDSQMQQVLAGSEALKNAAPLIQATAQGGAA